MPRRPLSFTKGQKDDGLTDGRKSLSPLSLSNPAKRGHCIMLLDPSPAAVRVRPFSVLVRRRAREEGESKSGHVRKIPPCLCERERPFPQRDYPCRNRGGRRRKRRRRGAEGRWMDLVIWIWANVSPARMEVRPGRPGRPGPFYTQLAGWLSAAAFADAPAPSTIYSRPLRVRSDCPKSGRDYQASWPSAGQSKQPSH